MTKVGSSQMRWVSLVGLLMLLLSVTPMGVAAQVGLTPVGDVAQEGDAPGGSAIEVLLVDCVPGAPEDPSDLIPGCTDGRAGINLQVTSTDPNLGINLPKVSVKPSDPGPGVINTGPIPLGEYRIEIDQPTNDYRFFFECRTRGATTNDVPVTPAPDGAANAFVVNNNADPTVDIVCQVWITPTGESPTMEVTYRECNRGDFPSDGRSFEDMQANCTNVSTNPPTFNVRQVDASTGATISETQHQQDAQGVVDLTLSPGNYEMFTDLDMNEWGEYLWCEYEGQPRYSKEFHESRGITSFTNLLPGEEFTCNWFGVNASEQASGNTSQVQQLQSEDEPEVLEPQAQQGQDVQPLADTPTTVQFRIDYRECERSAFSDDGRSHQQLTDNCTNLPESGPVFTVQNASGSATYTPDSTGLVAFETSPEDFSIFTDHSIHEWGEYLFCEYEGQPLYPKEFNEGVTGFSTLAAGEEIFCDWFAVSALQQQPEVEPSTNSNLDITMRACQTHDVTWDSSSVDAFRANCTPGVENMVFNLVNQNEDRLTGVSLPNGEATIANIPAGDWRLWSEIPLEFATEYYFCSIDDGAFAAVQLSDRGVASFPGLDGTQVTCEIYVVTENLRGEVTGASVEVHLALCPANYEGSSWYADCHDEGLDGYEFTLTGPAGELTAETIVERIPGPGIVRFTQLPAGDYELRGGPPLHDGEVFLYCSDPATNTQVPTTFEGGMGYFSLAENQSIVCDWYFIPTGQGPDPEPSPEPEFAEIFTTMFICPPDVNVAGSTFSQLDSACAERLNDVPMTLQSPGGVPITANTGASGDGAIRFFELRGGDYVLTPKLPAEFVSAAVYCDLDGGDVYQKALANGATTFVNVDGELISCSWFVTAKPQPAPGPTGSITIREMLCEGDRSTIKDWERECRPGASGVSFTITSSGGGVNQTLTPNSEGVAVFTGLPNEYYDVQQSEGAWCRAQAERVDAQSRVIVSGGGNTDVFFYQCNQQIGLPSTGAGPIGSDTSMPDKETIMLGAAALPMFAIAAWQIRRWQMATTAVASPVEFHEEFTRMGNGYRYR